MAKAINWPGQFRDEILGENTEDLFCALRLGTVYYDGRFWTDGEEVDIRCDQLRLRRAIVTGDLKACAIQELAPDDLSKLKSGLDSHDAVIQYLHQTYNQPVDPTTVVTVVTYRNLPIIDEAIESQDDPSKRYL
jgi:hypothetical protein